MNCKNCGIDIPEDFKYCGKCGGKIVEERFTINSLASEAFGDIFGWDSRFWDTLIALFKSPGKVVQGYLDGQRGRYMNPFSFYAFLLSISVILTTVFQAQVEDLLTQATSFSDQPTQDFGWFFNYQGLVAFLFLPIYTLLSFLSFGKPYNFGEHLIINVFTMSIVTLIGIFSMLLFLALNLGYVYLISSYVIMIFSYVYVYQGLYKAGVKKWIIFTLRFIGVLLLFFILLMLIGALFAIFIKATAS